MNADDLAARYHELRETRGTVPSLAPVLQRGEVCARCKQGEATKLVIRLRETMQKDEKLVCAQCWQVNAAIEGLSAEEAYRKTPLWLGEPRRVQHVTLEWQKKIHANPRRAGVTEERFARELDDWHRIAPLFEHVPRGENVRRWRTGVEAMVLLQHNDLGKHALVAEVGPTYHPDLGPWTEANVEATIRLVRIVVARRRRDPHWRRTAMAIEDGDAIGTGEAAQILERTTEYVRKLIDRGLLEAFDWSLPGAKRADWRVSKKACFAFRDRNPTGRATGNSQHSQQSQHPAESWAFSL